MRFGNFNPVFQVVGNIKKYDKGNNILKGHSKIGRIFLCKILWSKERQKRESIDSTILRYVLPFLNATFYIRQLP